MHIKETETPGYPKKFLRKNQGEPVKMTEYRSMVGKVIYLMTKLAPDLAKQPCTRVDTTSVKPRRGALEST